MKIKLDENMSVELADVFAGLGHDADTVPRAGLAGRLLVTQTSTLGTPGDFAPALTMIWSSFS